MLTTWSLARVTVMGSGRTFSGWGLMKGKQIIGVVVVGGYWGPSLFLLFFPRHIGEQPSLPCTPPCSMLQSKDNRSTEPCSKTLETVSLNTFALIKLIVSGSLSQHQLCVAALCQ